MKKPILLVEDNPSDAALTKRALTRAGIQNDVVVAADGVRALDYLRRTGEYADRDPDGLPVVVLLDLKLPKMNGIEVLHEIRADAATAKLPVVILTSSNQEKDRLAGYLEGANSYVRKPVEFSEFSEAVAQIGVYWVTLNEPAP